MLFATASNTTSLKNVTNGFLGLEGKMKHLNLKSPPKEAGLVMTTKGEVIKYLKRSIMICSTNSKLTNSSNHSFFR
jgi:hypothetical protein